MATPRAAVDPDLGVEPARRRRRTWDPVLVAVIAAGGILGAEARYALELAAPATPGAWPWATWWINVIGSFLLGALMVVVTDLTSPHRLVRPFLGVGVLGGFTTFSTAMVEVDGLLRDGRPLLAAAYLLGAALTALLAALAGAWAVRGLALARHRARARRSGR